MEKPITSTFVVELNKILDELVKDYTLLAKIGDITITNIGTKEEDESCKKEVFVIERKKD